MCFARGAEGQLLLQFMEMFFLEAQHIHKQTS